ncbi:MAG: FtsW/RodA/SpoVE family cell cycle protein [Puniceicoccales bacterium]|nr:FtsW/RodA/SpoVE family cell cycle protein [Puniceicoccales bacterium]
MTFAPPPAAQPRPQGTAAAMPEESPKQNSASPPSRFLNLEGGLSAFFARADWFTPLIILMLSAWSIAAIYSAKSKHQPLFWEQEFAPRQLLFVLIGWVAYWMLSLLDPRFIARAAWVFYAAGIALLLPTAACSLAHAQFFGPLVRPASGAWRWIYLPGFSVQPAELAKVATLALVALVAARGASRSRLAFLERKVVGVLDWACARRPLRAISGPLIEWIPTLTRVAWVAAIPFALILVQPDLSTALTYAAMTFAVLFVAGVPLRFFSTLAAVAALLGGWVVADILHYEHALDRYERETAAAVAEDAGTSRAADAAEGIRKSHSGIFPFLRNYQRERIVSLVNPLKIDRHGGGKSYQSQQARMAVARGGFSGQGYEKGSLVRDEWVPRGAAHNDFIFSCIAEESGFIGGTTLMGLFGLLFGLALRTAAGAGDKFGACLATGAATFFATHVIINVGMNIGLLPVTGLSLPFMSYGGSFILGCFLLFGILQSVHRAGRLAAAAEDAGADPSPGPVSVAQTAPAARRRRRHGGTAPANLRFSARAN